TKDDPTQAMLRFNTESLAISPSTWQETLALGQTQVSKSFELVSGGRTVAPIGFVELRSAGSTIPDVTLVNKQKTNVVFTVPKGARDVTVRTREVKGNPRADIDLVLLLNGKEIASSGNEAAEEEMDARVPGGSQLTLVIDAFDLLTQTDGKVDVEVEFALPAPLTGATTLTGQALPRGVAKTMTATLDLAGLATGVVDEVRTQFKTVVLRGEMELFDTKRYDDTKVGSVPLLITAPSP
ncbi:MAG: hypothetical protein AAB250_11915, partial [Bdellovibrionota bacterium]